MGATPGGFMSELFQHPEDSAGEAGGQAGGEPGAEFSLAIPDSPQQLLAMQKGEGAVPAPPTSSPRVLEVLERINALETTSAEDKQIALALLRKLEDLHDEIVEELRDDPEAPHSQIIAWSIDADRLTRARILLESVDLQ
jgi:hypothetical protein